MHTGASVWRKYNEIWRVVINEISYVYSRNLPGGQPPSGKSYDEIFLQVRKELFDIAEAKTARESKSKTGYTKKVFSILLWLRSGPRTKEPKLVGRRAGHGGTKESDVVRITL